MADEGANEEADEGSTAGQWPQIARHWQRLGSPLRPCAPDIASFAGVLEEWLAGHPGRAPRGLILGVTPELHDLAWPDRDRVLAADRTLEMIEHVWPGRRERARHCDWRAIPLEPASVDIALCDGGLHLLSAVDGQLDLARHLADILAPGALLAMRLFLPPAEREDPEAVIGDLLSGRIASLNHLKLRLGFALMPSPEEGVVLHQVWDRLRGLAGEGGWKGLAERLGWEEDHLAAIDGYRGSSARYHFVGEERAIALFTSGTGGRFGVVRAERQGYAMGAQCPTVVLKRL